MALYWPVSELEGERRALIIRAGSSLDARIRAAMAGLVQVVIGVRQLDAEAAKRVPKKDIGRMLTLEEAGALVKRIG
jgi:hypothetical protein